MTHFLNCASSSLHNLYKYLERRKFLEEQTQGKKS